MKPLISLGFALACALIGYASHPLRAQETEEVAESAPLIEVMALEEAVPIAQEEEDPPTVLPDETPIEEPDPTPPAKEPDYTLPMTIDDYIVKYTGVCPSQQPDHPFRESWGQSAAMGLRSPYPTPKSHLEAWWQQRHRDHLSGPWSVINFNNAGIPDEEHRTIYANMDDLTVWWEGPSDPAHDFEWEMLMMNLEKYLVEIEEGYQALCPGE